MSDDTLSFTDKNWDPNPVYELGNALIDFGDFLDEQAARMTGAEFDLNNGAWRGDAEMYMTQAFSDQRESVMNIIEEFWDTGEMINYYAMLRTEQEKTLAKQALAELIAGLVGVFLGALLFVGPELLGVLEAAFALLGNVGKMVASAISAVTTAASDAGSFVGSALTAIGETLPDWAVTMAGVTGNVARFGIEGFAINAASVAAGNAAAGLPTTLQQLIPVPTSLEQIPGFISDLVLWGGIGIAVATAAKGLVNVAREKLGITDVNVGDVSVNTADVGTSVGDTATGTGSGSGLTLPSSVTSVSGTIADSSKGLTKSDLTLSSDVEVNSAVTRTLSGTTLRTSTDTAPVPTPTKVTTTGAAEPPSAGDGTAVPNKVTPVDVGASPGSSSAVKTATDGATQAVQPAPKTETASGNANTNTITSGVADGSTGQSVLHDVGSGLSGVARTAQAAQRTVDASTVGQSAGGQESVGASGAERVLRTNLDAQPATAAPHETAPRTPSPTTDTAAGGTARDTGGNAIPGAAKAVDTGVRQAQSALRAVGDDHATASDASVRNASAEEAVSPVRSVPSGKGEVVRPAGPVREASVGRIEGGGRTAAPETAGRAGPASAAGEQGARGTVDGGTAAKEVGTRANLGDTSVRSGADQGQRASGATDGTRTVPNAGRAPLKSAAGLGGRPVRPVGRAEEAPADGARSASGTRVDVKSESGDGTALTGPTKDMTSPVEPAEGTSAAAGTLHGVSAKSASEADGSAQTRTGAPGETSGTQFGSDEARSAVPSDQVNSGRTAPDRRSADTERQQAADPKAAAAQRAEEKSADATTAAQETRADVRDPGQADRSVTHESAATDPHAANAESGAGAELGHEQAAFDYRHDMSAGKNAAYEESKRQQNETYTTRLANEAQRAEERLEHNRRLWNAFDDVRTDLSHEYPAVRSEAVGDIEAVVRGEGVSDHYAEGMADSYRNALEEHRTYLKEHPEKRADELQVGIDSDTGAVTHSPLQAKLVKALESVLDDGYRGPSPAELVEAIHRSSDESSGPKSWAGKLGVPEDLVSTVASAFHEARFEHSRAGETDLDTHAFEQTLTAKLEDHLGNLQHGLSARSLADRMIREENRFQGAQPRPWREEVKQRLESRIAGVEDAVEQGDISARQGEAAKQSLYEGLPQEFALEAAVRQLRGAAAEAFDRAMAHPDRPGENLFVSEALFDRRPFSARDEASLRTDFLDEFTAELRDITRQLDLDGTLVHRDFLTDLVDGAQPRFDALVRGLETRLVLAEDATRTFDAMADARSLDRSSDDIGTVREEFLDEYAKATGELSDGRTVRELSAAEYADTAHQFNRTLRELQDRWAARLDAKAAERDLRAKADELRDNPYVASRNVADKVLADHNKAFDDEVTGLLGSRKPEELSVEDWDTYRAELEAVHGQLMDRLGARHDLHSGLEEALTQADKWLYAAVGVRKETELGSQAKRVQDDMHKTLTDAYRERVGMPEEGQWSAEELNARDADFGDTVLDPYTRSLGDRLAYEGAFDAALAEGGRRFNELTSKVDEATGSVTGRYALNGHDLGRVADDFRSDAARAHQGIYGPAGRDSEAALGTERADGDVFGTARDQARRDLVHEVEMPRHRAEQDAWRAQLGRRFASLDADVDVRRQVETQASAIGSDSVRQTFREDSRQVLDSLVEEAKGARTPGDLGTAVRAAQEKIQSLYDDAATLDAEHRQWRENPEWTLDFSQLTIDRTPFREAARPQEKADATSAPDTQASGVSQLTEGAGSALADLRAGAELREAVYQEFDQRLAANPAFAQTIPYAEQVTAREWFADRRTEAAQQPDGGHDALNAELDDRLAQAHGQAKATAKAYEVFDREIALSWKQRVTYASFGTSPEARAIRNDFGQAMATAVTAGEEVPAAELVKEFRQRYTQVYENWRAEQWAHQAFQKALVLSEAGDLAHGRPTWAKEQRAWYDSRLRELREQYTAEWLAAGEGRPSSETVSRLEVAVRNAASRLMTQAESLGRLVQRAVGLTEARGAEPGWSPELAFSHTTEQAVLVRDFLAYAAHLPPGDRTLVMTDLAVELDALLDAARVRNLAQQDFARSLSAVRLAPLTVTSGAVVGWARGEIDRIRAEHVREFEETYRNSTTPVRPQEQEQVQQSEPARQLDAEGLSDFELFVLTTDVNKLLREVKWPHGPASAERAAELYAELPSYWKKDLKSTAEVIAREVMGLRRGLAPGGASGAAAYTSSGDTGAASASTERPVLPIGSPVVLEGPRRVGELTEVPAPTVPLTTGKGKGREEWFTYRRPSPLGSAPVEYDVSDTGNVRTPSGEVLAPDGWVRFGGDFVQLASGALLLGDTGWLGQVHNMDELLARPDFPAPGTARHTLVADASHIHLVPTGPSGARGATAVRITLDPGTLPATEPTTATTSSGTDAGTASGGAAVETSAGTASGEAPAQPPVPEIVVTPPGGEREPWYLAFDAMGQAVVPDSVEQIEFTERQAGLWADRVARSLVLPGAGSHDALRAGIREEVGKLLLTEKAGDWDDVLAVGRTEVVNGRLVWLRPMLRALTPVPPTTGDVSEYPVGFAVTQTGGETSRETVQGADSVLFTALNLGTSVAASIAALAVPQVLVGSSKEKSNAWGQTVLSGRKPFINKFNRFTAGLEMHVFVGGEEATRADRLVTVPDRVQVDLPAPYSEEGQHRPDLTAPEPSRPTKPRRTGPSQARELLNAVNLTPAIAGLHRNLLAAGLPAPHVKKIMTGLGMDKSQGFLSEPTARNRYAWWAGGDVSNSVEVSGPLGRRFQGHLRVQAEVDSLQYLGDTNVATRDDIGAGFSRTASNKGGSVAGLGGGYNTAGIGGGGADASTAGTDPETTPGHEAPAHESVEVKGVAPAVGASMTGDRGAGYSLDTAHMSHTVLNVFGDQSRYRTGLRLTATMESSTHNVAPVVVTTESEQSVPQREAAQFVAGTVGPGWTADLRPVDGGTDARRHRVHALPAPRQVRKLPTVRSPFRFGMGVSGPGLLPPHPREPLPLASRRGLGFGMPIALPGTETLQQDLRDAIERHHVKAIGAKKASKSDWSNADRDLAMFYGRSALEADPNQALLGIHRTIEVAGHRYKVSAKMNWGDRVTGTNPLTGPVNEDNPLGQTYSMKVNARVVSGATVAGERGKGAKARFAFGGGARLAIPEHEFNIGSLSLRTPPFRLAVGAFRGLLSRSWGKSDKFAGLAKEYRRTETAKKVDEHRYGMTLQWTVTPEAKKPSYLSGSNPATARIVVPHEHVPAEPVSLKQAQAAGRTEVTGQLPATERPLDFSTGTHGLYPVFHLMPELAQLGARLYARQHGLPDSWLRDPAEWPEEIRDLAHPGILTSRFGAMTGALGHQSELPKDGRHKQAFRIRLHTHAPSDLGRSPDVEVEHYAQAAASHAAEKQGEWALGLAGSVGPQFRFGADANDEEGHHGDLGGRLTVLGYGEAAKKWGDGSGRTAGRIDITRATYGGDVHTVRATPVFEVTYVRWRGKELTETTEFLTADEALDLLTPERRLSDIMPGGAATAETTGTPETVTLPAIVVTSPEGEESAVDPVVAMPAALPTIVVTPPDGEEHATDPGTAAAAIVAVPDPTKLSPTRRQQSVAPPPRTRTYLHQDLIAGIGHPEVMRAEGVLDAITDRLRGRGVVTTERAEGVGPRPNLLMRSLSSSFSSDALRSEWYALTTNQGVSRWFPVPGPFGSTRYLWVKVSATRLGAATGQQPRDDIKLTLRGESADEKSTSKASGSEFSGGLDLRGRIGAGSLHGGLEGGAEYSTSRGEADEEAEKSVKIYRANPKDASEEFNHDLTFRVETGTTTELPEVLSLPARGVGRITRLFSGQPSRDKGVFTWYDAGDGTPGNAPLVEGGNVRLLVPRHLTAAVEAWPEAIDLTGAHETEVTWTPGPKPNTLKKRNPAQPVAPAPQVSEPAPQQEADQDAELPEALLENLHPWSVPAAAAVGRWAAVTAVRHRTPPALDVHAPPHVSGLNFTTRAGLRYQHYTSGNMMRPHIKELLKQTYKVPVGDETVVVGLELDGAEILGPPEGTLIKQRTYTQTDEEPKHAVERESGWQFALGPEMGGSLGEHKMFDRLPITIKNWMNGRKRTTAVGDTDERNKEGQRPYRLYRFDVTAVMKGPHGTVRAKVPDGLFGMLPIDKATGKLADGLEERLPSLLGRPPIPAPPMPTRPAPAPPVPARTSSLAAETSRPAPQPPMPTRPAPAPPVPQRTSSLSARTSHPPEVSVRATPGQASDAAEAPVADLSRSEESPQVQRSEPRPALSVEANPVEANPAPETLPTVDGRTVVRIPGQDGLLLQAARGATPQLLGSGADSGLFTVANVNNRLVVQQAVAGGPVVHTWMFTRLGGLRLAEEKVLLSGGHFDGSMITIAGGNVADVPADADTWPARLGEGDEVTIASPTGTQIYRRTTGRFVTVSTPGHTPPVRPAQLTGEQGRRWDAAVNLARTHLGAAAAVPELKLYMTDVSSGAFTAKKRYGGFVSSPALEDGTDLVARVREFNRTTRDLLYAGPNQRVTLWRGVSMDPHAAQADEFVERLPASTSNSRDFQARWARNGVSSNRVVFEIDVPADHGKLAMAYPPGYAPAADDAPAHNQDQGEVTLSPTRLIRTGPSRIEDGITVIPVRAEQIPAGELEGVITEEWPGLPSATAFEDFGRAFEQSSLRKWPGLRDAVVGEVGTDPLVRTFVVSRPGFADELTVTVTHKPADNAVALTFSGDGVPAFSQEWSGTGFSGLAEDLRGNVLHNNDLFPSLPTPASWSGTATTPPETLPTAVTGGPLSGPGKAAVAAPARLDTVAAATFAGGRDTVDPALTGATAPAEPWTTGKVTFKEGSAEVAPLQRGHLTLLARKVAEAGLRDVRAGLPAPGITVTGYGNGSWLTPGLGDWGARRTGQDRADAVASVLRTEIRNALYLLQRNDPPSAGRVGDDDFLITTRSRGQDLGTEGQAGGVELRARRRQAAIEVEVAAGSAAFERLDALRRADPDPALHQGPFDPGPLARRILGLPPTRPVTGTQLRELTAVLDEATAAGRATSLPALSAQHLVRQGALSAATLITAPDGRALGRNWTDEPVVDLFSKSYAKLRDGQLVDLEPALWVGATGDQRPFVIVAEGDQDQVTVRLADGSRQRVPVTDFAELLAADPELAALDSGLPVALVVPGAGAGNLRLPRTAAARTGRTVWSHSGAVSLYQDPREGRTRIAVTRGDQSKEPLGSWFAGRPDDLTAGDPAAEAEDRVVQTIDGTLVPDDEILSETMAADGIPHGRAVFDKADLLRRELYLAAAPAMTETRHLDPLTGEEHGAAEDVPWAGRKAYYFYLHGLPGAFELQRRDGTVKWARGDEVGGYLRRRPSLRGLAADGVIVLMSCWVGAPAEQPPIVNSASRAPFVADRLETVSEAQRVANRTGRTVYAVDRVHVTGGDSLTAHQAITMTPDGRPSRWEELRPEPTETELDELARTAGLHTDPGPASAETRVTALRLVRALRQTFGASVEDDKDDAAGRYQRLLSGIGALETMRRDDQLLRNTGQFTLDLLDRATRSRLGLPPAPAAAVAPDDVETLLDAARSQRSGTALRDFVPLRSLELALAAPADPDPDRRARRVLRLGSAPVTPAHRQHLLWAMVAAVETLQAAPDTDALAAKVLHLDVLTDPVDDARLMELFWTAAGAAAAGRDTGNPAALAAFHLERKGALSHRTLLRSATGEVIGRNWTGRQLTDPLTTERYLSVAAGADPARARSRNLPWNARAASGDRTPQAYFLLADGGPDALDIPWPDGTRRPVPHDEIAELLTHDDHLTSFGPSRPVVPVVPHSGSGTALTNALTDRAVTARKVYAPAVDIELFHDTRAGEHVIAVTTPPAGPGRADWIRTRPAKLPAAAATTPAAPVVTGVTGEALPTSAVRTPAAPESWTSARITFEEGSKEVGPDQRDTLAALARTVVETGLRDLRDGFAAPWITVTGHGNGSWLKVASGDRGAGRTGQERADAVADVLRTEIGDALDLLRRDDPGTADRVDADAFRINSRSAGRNVAVDGSALRGLRRQADVEVDPALRSPAVELLNSLRLAEPASGLADGPFDPDPLARGILHLTADEPVREAHRQALYDLVDEADAAGRATSLAALGAFDFWKRGVLSPATRITAPDGRALGRNWTDTPAPDLITATYHQLGGSGVQTPTALWEPGGAGDNRPYVVAAKGGDDHVVVRLADRSRTRATPEEFAELLSMDQDLAALDGRLPVVLAVPRAGRGSPRLPRTAASRTRRTVWAHSGRVKLYEDPSTRRTGIAVIDRRSLGEPLGSWFASEPDDPQLTARQTPEPGHFVRMTDGTLVPDDEIMSHTLAADGRPYGRAVLDTRDQSVTEPYVDSLPTVDEYVHIDPVHWDRLGDAENVPWSGRPAYYFLLHGNPGAFSLVRTDGARRQARGDQVGEYLQRRPSVRGLAADGVVVLMSCWVGAAADGLPRLHATGRAPYVADPLTTLSEAQQVANRIDRTVFAVDRVYYLTLDKGTRGHGLAATVEGERRTWLELRPEPTGTALDAVIATAGLHSDPGPAPAESRVTALRLVRALRQTFGASVEDDKDDVHGEYQRLLRGIGALESMRRNDPKLRDAGPFTLDLLERAARSHRVRSGGPAESAVDATDVRALLEAAGTRPAGMALGDFVPLPSVDRALALLADGDPGQRAAEVLDLTAGPVTEVHRQRLLWATVKAVESLEATTDLDALAAKVLHLDASAHPVDEARRTELLWTAAGAAALGRDLRNPTALAAHHLERNGALSAHTLLKSEDGDIIGRDWIGMGMADPFVPDRYLAASHGTDAANARMTSAPWRADGVLTPAYLVLGNGGPDHLDLPWPDGSRRPVPVAEIAELLAIDPVLSARPPGGALVPIVPRTGPGEALAKALSSRTATARTVYTPAVDADIFHDTLLEKNLVVVAPQPPGSASGSAWVRTDPPPLATAVPAAPAAPAPVVVMTADAHGTGGEESAPAVLEPVEGPMPNAVIPTDAADIIPPPIPYPARPVFVADTGSPDAVRTEGLAPGGTGLDLVAYAQVGGADHGFVSADTSPGTAAQRLNDGHVWEIDAPGGIDITATLDAYGIAHGTSAEAEVLFAGGVASRFIKGAWRIVPATDATAENTLGEWIPNPNHPSYDAGKEATPMASMRRLPIQPVLDKRVFRVEDVVSTAELQALSEALAVTDPAPGEQYAQELGTRLTEHITAGLATENLAVGHVDLHLSVEDPDHSMAGMALARVVANGVGRRAMLTVGALRTPTDICPSRN